MRCSVLPSLIGIAKCIGIQIQDGSFDRCAKLAAVVGIVIKSPNHNTAVAIN